jgi:response regulator RpfG family c-di-GMP phosphodiesterase
MAECLSPAIDLQQQANATLLIVDDMPENLEVLGGLLRGSGYRAIALSDTADKEHCRHIDPDAVDAFAACFDQFAAIAQRDRGEG